MGGMVGGVMGLAGTGSAKAQSAPYVPYSGLVAGTDGTDPVTLSLGNAMELKLECSAALAHWYSQALGQIEPGTSLDVSLWHDPANGALNLMNETGYRMPVEAIWCAVAGDVSATRTPIALPFTQGSIPARMSRTCRAGAQAGSALNCR
jgi:hypothetical protein